MVAGAVAVGQHGGNMATEAQVLGKYTESWVTTRADTMKAKYGNRKSLMDDFESIYLLDVWTGTKEADERRVTSPRGMMVVDAARALLFTRRPVLEVPASDVRKVSEDTADNIEKYLYGAWDLMRMHHVNDLAEWYATCLGQGWLRVVYDPETPRGEYPLVAQALDPRTIYYEPDPRQPFADREVAHWLQRTRREVLFEWGSYPDMTPEEARSDEWLDTKVDYIDYWAAEVVEAPEEEEEEEEPLGVLGRAVANMREFLQPEEEEEEGEREGDANRNKALKRAAVNCVLVEGKWLKEPVVVPGYARVPFFRWGGISTPLEGEHAALSVLYPIAGGERTGESQGLIATENEILGMQLRLVEQRAGAAAITNAEDLANLDASPGAVNVTNRSDYKIDWTVPPGSPPDLAAFLAEMGSLAEQATIPGALMGQYQAAISGVALSMLTSPVLMRIAARQREREEVLQELNKHVLALTEEYAPRKGWTVWGYDKQGVEAEVRLAPGSIRGYRRNRVHLSARLPRDAPNEIIALAQLVDKKMLSRRTGIERIQQVLDLAGQSPSDEMQQILIEDILLEQDATRQAMAERALQEYDAALAEEVIRQRQAAQAPPPQAGPGAPGGPMGGVPPETAPPQGVPAAVGARNPRGMMAMQQGPPGPFPGRPRGT
jgi:hypothetical protein